MALTRCRSPRILSRVTMHGGPVKVQRACCLSWTLVIAHHESGARLFMKVESPCRALRDPAAIRE